MRHGDNPESRTPESGGVVPGPHGIVLQVSHKAVFAVAMIDDHVIAKSSPYIDRPVWLVVRQGILRSHHRPCGRSQDFLSERMVAFISVGTAREHRIVFHDQHIDGISFVFLRVMIIDQNIGASVRGEEVVTEKRQPRRAHSTRLDLRSCHESTLKWFGNPLEADADGLCALIVRGVGYLKMQMRSLGVSGVAAQADHVPLFYQITHLHPDGLVLEMSQYAVFFIPVIDHHVVSGGVGQVSLSYPAVVRNGVFHFHHFSGGRSEDFLTKGKVTLVSGWMAGEHLVIPYFHEVKSVALVGIGVVIVYENMGASHRGEPSSAKWQDKGRIGKLRVSFRIGGEWCKKNTADIAIFIKYSSHSFFCRSINPYIPMEPRQRQY